MCVVCARTHSPRIFLEPSFPASILRCGRANLPRCVRLHPPYARAPFAFMDMCVCVCLPVYVGSSFPPLPAPAPCHSEEPGGDSRGRGGKALTAATCHISQLEFGGNQFGTLIRSMTPTPAAAEQGPGQRLSPTAPAKKMGELNPGGHKSSILNHLLQTNGGANLASPAKLNYYWLDKKLQRIYIYIYLFFLKERGGGGLSAS